MPEADANPRKVGPSAEKPAGNRGMGRKKGVPNKVTGEIKEMVLVALSNVGGAKYLEKQAHENPTAFLTLVGKVLPLQVNASHSGNVCQEVIFRRAPDAA